MTDANPAFVSTAFWADDGSALPKAAAACGEGGSPTKFGENWSGKSAGRIGKTASASVGATFLPVSVEKTATLILLSSTQAATRSSPVDEKPRIRLSPAYGSLRLVDFKERPGNGDFTPASLKEISSGCDFTRPLGRHVTITPAAPAMILLNPP